MDSHKRVFRNGAVQLSEFSCVSIVQSAGGAVLIYHYLNEPKPNAMKTMHAHKGTAVLRLKNDEFMEGEYYTGRDRQNYGGLTLRRVSKTCR